MICTEPCTTTNPITYLYFCTLGGLSHPRTRKVAHWNGPNDVYFTYHYCQY